MSITKITERNLDEKFLQTLYTKDNPPTVSDVGAVAESDLATAIQSLIEQGVIEVGGKAYTPSSNLLKTLVSTTKSGKNGAGYYIGKWIPEKSGAVKISAVLRTNGSSGTGYFNIYWTNDDYNYENKSNYLNTIGNLETLAAGATVNSTIAPAASYVPMVIRPTDRTATTYNLIMDVKKGSPIYFVITSNTSGMLCYCDSLKIYADEV